MDNNNSIHIEMKDINLTFANKTFLQKVSLQVQKGRKMLIQGPSGCGKSSLLHLILGFYKPSEGQIHIDGQQLNEKTVHMLRHKMAYIPQEPDLGEEQVADFLKQPFSYHANQHLQYDENEIKDLFKYFNLPIKLLSQKCTELSGGQKQRCSIISAITLKRAFYLFDEPMSALDLENKKILLDWIRSHPEKTMIFVSHDDLMKEVSDQVLELTPFIPEDSL